MTEQERAVSELSRSIRDIPDFPRPGVIFKDITPLLNDSRLFRRSIGLFKELIPGDGIDKIAAIESRGFIFGSAIAHDLGLGLVPVRKFGKLPYKTIRKEYSLEYGKDSIEIHSDAVKPGERVIIIDDLIATGGTAKAAADLITETGGRVVSLIFLIELRDLKGTELISGYPYHSIIVV